MTEKMSMSLKVMEIVQDYPGYPDKDSLDLISYPDPNPGGTEFWENFRDRPGWLEASADIVDLVAPLEEAGYRKKDYKRSYSVTIPKVVYGLLTTLILPKYPEQMILKGKGLVDGRIPEKIDLQGFSPIQAGTGPEIVLIAPDHSVSDVQVLPTRTVKEVPVPGATREASEYFLRNSQYILDQDTLTEVFAAFPDLQEGLGITNLSQLRAGQFLKWSGIFHTYSEDFPEWLQDLESVRKDISGTIKGEEKYFFPTEAYFSLKQALRRYLRRKKK